MKARIDWRTFSLSWLLKSNQSIRRSSAWKRRFASSAIFRLSPTRPKYDGFRCVVFRDKAAVALQSRRQRPLGRFFPEVEAAVAALPVAPFVMDGELVIRGAAFDTLQMRLHPAASRIARLSREHPATFVAFDLLAEEGGVSLLDTPFAERRAALEALFDKIGNAAAPGVMLGQSIRSRARALHWLDNADGLDGIVAKRLDLPYKPGRRAMQKYKQWHTVDCVVAGVYRKSGSEDVEYLLLGLYDDAGRLNYVGRCATQPHVAEITAKLRPLLGGSGFTGNAPGGPNSMVEARARRDTGTSGTGGGGERGYHYRRKIPPWLSPAALARRQGAGTLHHGAGRGSARGVTATLWV